MNSNIRREIEDELPKTATSNRAVSASTAGIRAVLYQLQTLYLRTPVKLFRPSRFDYLAYVREIANQHGNLDQKKWSFRTHSSLAMFVNVIRKEGWKFIPDQVLPPLIANSITGVILYGSYLTALDQFERSRAEMRIYEVIKAQHLTGVGTSRDAVAATAAVASVITTQRHDAFYAYHPYDTWRAGFIAGVAQSLAAAPVDAIYARLTTAELLNGNHQNLWVYGARKLRDIGLVGVFAGYSFSLVKESLGFAFYFSTFELVKTKGYSFTYQLIALYRKIKMKMTNILPSSGQTQMEVDPKLVRLENNRLTKVLKSSFVLLAGASAAFSLLAIQYPINKIQKMHLSRLEVLDIYNDSKTVVTNGTTGVTRKPRPFFTLYYNSYIDTFNQIRKYKRKSRLTWFQLGYKGFLRNALFSIPATSVGLLVFEIMRTKLADLSDEQFH